MLKKLFYDFVQWNFHQILNFHFKKQREGAIIQLGANDGKTIDPVNFLIKQQKNRSILLEPVPHVFKKLKETYKGTTATLLNMAVSEKEDVTNMPFYYLKEIPGIAYSDSYSWFGSFNINHIEKFRSGVRYFDEMLQKENVDCISINKLIRDYAPEGVALLHIDVEGFDAKIILSLDFKLAKPEIILFEHIHIEVNEFKACLSKLRKEGYRTYSYGFDTICIQPKIKTDILLRMIKGFKPAIFH